MSHRPFPGRRSVLRGSLAASAALTLPTALGAAPAFARSGRPKAGWGVQAGDVTCDSGLVWVRSDRPGPDDRGDVGDRVVPQPAQVARPAARRPGTDFTGTTPLRGLPSGEQIHYRVLLADPDDPRRTGEPVTGTFRTASARRRDGVRFVWSGDLAGQGWGINPDLGGYRIYDAMAALDPDFFLCSGDNIYADGPLTETVALPDGRTWRNITTEEKSKVAETLAEFRGNFRYNLLDENLRALQRPGPVHHPVGRPRGHQQLVPGRDPRRHPLHREERRRARLPRPAGVLASTSRSRRCAAPTAGSTGCQHHGPLLDVFVLDMRTYRNANSTDDQPADAQGILGREQLEWLKRELSRSRAVWKVIASDMPIGLVVPDTGDGKPNIEAVAQGDPGKPLGRELQIAELLRFIKHRRITGTVWLTADVHYTSAQHYQPSRAAFTDFEPFWEFVSGPLNAGAFPANTLDGTFGPDRVFIKAPTTANVSPADGYQFFGEVDIDGDSGELTVRLREQDGTVLFTQVLQPGRVGQ